MKFIALELVGGLGNQLFQYAMARSLMERNDRILFNTTSYKNDFYGRHFTLDKFKIKGQTLQDSAFERFFNPNSKVNYLVKKIGQFSQISEKGFYIHHNIKEQLKLFTVLKGYWQSFTYFKKIKPELQQEIIPVTMPPLPEVFKQKETVVVHIRRTDFLNDPRFGVIDKGYYVKAIKEIKSLVKSPFFIFFSDDIEWCRQNFYEDDSQYCNYPDWQHDYHRLYLMSQCKHHIISNSSFSWWGAWLCNNQGQVVIRPARPFQDISLLYEQYYPNNWRSMLN